MEGSNALTPIVLVHLHRTVISFVRVLGYRVRLVDI